MGSGKEGTTTVEVGYVWNGIMSRWKGGMGSHYITLKKGGLVVG